MSRRVLRVEIPLIVVVLFCAASLPPARAAASAHFSRAVEFRFRGHTDAAIAEYRRGLDEDPSAVNGHVQLGEILLEEKGDVDAAISEFLTALDLDPQCGYCQRKLNEALDLKNSTASEQILRGNQLYSTGHLTRAAAAYRLAIDCEPENAVAHNSLAWTLYGMGELDEGIFEVRRALELRPGDAEFTNTLACLLFDKGQVDQAIAQWKKALSASKTPNPADLYGMAIGSLAKGDRASASRYFSEAVKIDPKYADARYIRDRIGMSVRSLSSHDRLVSLAAAERR